MAERRFTEVERTAAPRYLAAYQVDIKNAGRVVCGKRAATVCLLRTSFTGHDDNRVLKAGGYEAPGRRHAHRGIS